MPRTFTVSEVMDQARQRADMENSQFVKDQELIGYLDDEITDLYDMLVEAYGDTYYQKYYTFSTSTGINEYDLPSDFFKSLLVEAQFNSIWYTLRKYQYPESNKFAGPFANSWMTFPSVMQYRLTGRKLHLIPSPVQLVNMRLRYVPVPPLALILNFQPTAINTTTNQIRIPNHLLLNDQAIRFSCTSISANADVLNNAEVTVGVTNPGTMRTDTDYYVIVVDGDTISLSTTSSTDAGAPPILAIASAGVCPAGAQFTIESVFDGISGWEQYCVLGAAITMKMKEESDVTDLKANQAEIGQKIEKMKVNRDVGMPNQMVDYSRQNENDGGGWGNTGWGP